MTEFALVASRFAGCLTNINAAQACQLDRMGPGQAALAAEIPYRAFTTSFDQVVGASTVASPAERRILIVVSDGAPSDQATLTNNSDPSLLDRHLRTVISDIERDQRVDLSAIGINHDVSQTYARAAMIKDPATLWQTLIKHVEGVIFDTPRANHAH